MANFSDMTDELVIGMVSEVELSSPAWPVFRVPIMAASFDQTLTTAIFVAFVVGKPTGVVLFSFAAVKLRLAILPRALSWGLLAAGSLLTGIGFTMALFIAELAFASALLDSVKLGVMGASVVSDF